MFSDQSIQDRRAAWDAVVGFYSDLVARNSNSACCVLLDLVRALRESPQASRFRPGTSHNVLVISTAVDYKLGKRDRFIAVGPRNENGEMSVFYCKGTGAQREVARPRTLDEALHVIDPLLRRIWSDMTVSPMNGPN